MQVAQVLNNLQAAARASGESSAVSIAVDDRSNSILLSGPKSMRLRMRMLIAKLDEPAASAAGNTEVVYLRYLEAKTFAPLLGKIAQNILGKGGSDSGASVSSAQSAQAHQVPSHPLQKICRKTPPAFKQSRTQTLLLLPHRQP